jgi:hypothetical protein
VNSAGSDHKLGFSFLIAILASHDGKRFELVKYVVQTCVLSSVIILIWETIIVVAGLYQVAEL